MSFFFRGSLLFFFGCAQVLWGPPATLVAGLAVSRGVSRGSLLLSRGGRPRKSATAESVDSSVGPALLKFRAGVDHQEDRGAGASGAEAGSGAAASLGAGGKAEKKKRQPWAFLPPPPPSPRGAALPSAPLAGPAPVPLLDRVMLQPHPTPNPPWPEAWIPTVPPKGFEGWYATLPPKLVPGWAQGVNDFSERYFKRCLGGPPPCGDKNGPYTIPPSTPAPLPPLQNPTPQ